MATHTLLRVFLFSAASMLGACASSSSSNTPHTTNEQPSMKTYTGVLRSGFAGIGGESTGWMLESADLDRPIDADVTKVSATAREWEGKPVRVWGRIVTKKYVERGEVSIFVVERIDPVV